MAFNSWDKLAKAQRDYPKLKAAGPFVDKQLKRNTSNPYLLAWKADLALQRDMHPQYIVADLLKVYQNNASDAQLLSYLYKLSFEASRRAKSGSYLNSIGPNSLKFWQAMAKTMPRAKDRMELWDLLFQNALREDAWEDARFAIVNYTKEGPSDKKHFHYLLTLATKLSADQQAMAEIKDDRQIEFSYTIALQYMKKSFYAPPDDAIAVNNIRDLRFMAELFRDQDHFAEIFSFWDNPPETLSPLLKRHRDDLLPLMIQIAQQRYDWALVIRLCLTLIDEKLALQKEAGDSGTHIWELCARRSDLWASLVMAVQKRLPKPDGVKLISEQMKKCFGDGLKHKDRPSHLTYMLLGHSIGRRMLPLCKNYFENYSHLPSCFADIRPFLSFLPPQEVMEFMGTVRIKSGLGLESAAHKDAMKENILQTTFAALKFQYMFLVSQNRNEDPRSWHRLFRITLSFWQQNWPENFDVGYLAIYLLLNIHYRAILVDEHRNPLGTTLNSRILLQATMLARHLVARDKEKQHKTLALFASRLHLNLGLGTMAFRFYGNVKPKEMLVDTLSPWILSRISQTHPFEAKGYGGFSADEELQHVIETIERMERKTEDIICRNMSSFHWDTAMETTNLKWNLGRSLTKHLCVIERKRIARLRGESVENLPRLDFKAYQDISDHWDRLIFPNFESEQQKFRCIYLIMPNAPANLGCLIEQHFTQDRVNAELYRESHKLKFYRPTLLCEENMPTVWPMSNFTQIEKRLKIFWDILYTISTHFNFLEERQKGDTRFYGMLVEHVLTMRRALEKLRMPGKTTLATQDEPTMFHENMLITLYGQMEVCRAINKLVEYIREEVLKPNPKSKAEHPMKSILPDKFDINLLQETQVCFNAVHDVAQSYIHLLQTRGVKAVTAQVRWGPTGECLREILTDDDVENYAKEYVESALEAWRGVLRVKLK